MQGWPPEMQKTILHLGQPSLHVGLVLPRTTAERSFCISDSHPCMSALLFYFYYFTILLSFYFTILLFYYFTILLFYSRYGTAAADV